MSRENVEIVRRYIDAWQRDSDAMIDLLDPDLEWAPVEESHSGVEVELVQYSQFTVRNRRITHIYEHAARADALEAAGLSE